MIHQYLIAAALATFPHHHECHTERCAKKADGDYARLHRRKRFWRRTTASWFDDSTSLACPRVSGPGVANRTIPCGTRLRICHRRRCETAIVEDRGPFVTGRDLDLDPQAKAVIACSDLCTVTYAHA